ncbi:MAG: 50S ribosomal protein L6, partial [Atopobiaceae bacterium]|nr:50S ribosomal protein L6 [Atopobiaceae bacterium]
MSRIGKKPVQIPAGVTVTVDGTHVAVKGPKGELERTFSNLLEIVQEGEEIIVKIPRTPETADLSHEDFKLTQAYQAANDQQGLTRTLLHTLVEGVSEGFEKKLEM